MAPSAPFLGASRRKFSNRPPPLREKSCNRTPPWENFEKWKGGRKILLASLFLTKLKDWTSIRKLSNIVYKYTCGLCNEKHIGYTETLVLDRFNEHNKNGTTEESDHM